MNIKDITLVKYSDSATKQFGELHNRLGKIESSFSSRMNGRSTAGLVASLIGTIAWLVIFLGCAYFVKGKVDNILMMIGFGVVMGLMLFMMIDNIINFVYYGKIASHKRAITALKKRVDDGKYAISQNYNSFLKSKENGWNYRLNVAPSIPDQAMSIETTMSNMASLSSGFLNGAKNVFFYAAAVAVTIVGCLSLFETGGNIMCALSGEDLSETTMLVLSIIALVIVGIAEIILAKLVWSKTDCEVTNLTLLILALGPVAYLALISVGALLVMLVIGLISVIIAIAGVVFAIFCAIGIFCGG